jgi:hypothetical protein
VNGSTISSPLPVYVPYVAYASVTYSGKIMGRRDEGEGKGEKRNAPW